MAQPASALVINCPLIEPLGVVRDLWRDYPLKPLRHVVEINAIAAGESHECPNPTAVAHGEFKDFAHLALGFRHGFNGDIERAGVSELIKIRARAGVVRPESFQLPVFTRHPRENPTLDVGVVSDYHLRALRNRNGSAQTLSQFARRIGREFKK